MFSTWAEGSGVRITKGSRKDEGANTPHVQAKAVAGMAAHYT